MFRFAHNNLNVLDLHEVGGIDDGKDFKIVFTG